MRALDERSLSVLENGFFPVLLEYGKKITPVMPELDVGHWVVELSQSNAH